MAPSVEKNNGLDAGKGKIFERGFYDYADEFGMTPEAFDAFLDNHRVLDVGSGRGMLAIDVERRKLDDALYAKSGPNIFPLNVRYRDDDYKEEWKKNFWNELVSKRSDTAKLQRALGNALTRIQPYDWNNLDELLAKKLKFGRIISCNGFPYYSEDFISPSTDSADVTHFKMGEQSKKVFRDIVALMEDDGEGLFEIKWDSDFGALPTEFLNEASSFFSSIGVKTTVYPARIENASYLLHLKKGKL